MDLHKLDSWWIKVNSDGKIKRNTYILIGFVLLKILFASYPLFILDLMAVAVLALALAYYYESWSSKAFLAAVIIFTLTTWFITLIAFFVGVFFLYKAMERWRVRKIKEITKRPVHQLSGVSRTGAEVEVVIRGKR
jgi:predicted membrane protein